VDELQTSKRSDGPSHNSQAVQKAQTSHPPDPGDYFTRPP
jgi:hypothetical protein